MISEEIRKIAECLKSDITPYKFERFMLFGTWHYNIMFDMEDIVISLYVYKGKSFFRNVDILIHTYPMIATFSEQRYLIKEIEKWYDRKVERERVRQLEKDKEYHNEAIKILSKVF